MESRHSFCEANGKGGKSRQEPGGGGLESWGRSRVCMSGHQQVGRTVPPWRVEPGAAVQLRWCGGEEGPHCRAPAALTTSDL